MDKLSKFPNLLPLGIIATIFCFPPFGVISVIYACKVQTALAQDNTALAILAAEKAKFWAVVAIAAGALTYFSAWVCMVVL